MRKLYLGMVVLALAAVPAAVSAQGQGHEGMGRGMGRGMGMGMMRNPVSMIIEHQQELGLTPSQLEKLGKIRDKFEHDNGKALKEMAEDRDKFVKKYGEGPYTDEQREDMRKAMAEHREDRQKLMENSRKAREEIREVLTPEQFAKLQQMMPMRDQRMGAMNGMRGQDQDRDRH